MCNTTYTVAPDPRRAIYFCLAILMQGYFHIYLHMRPLGHSVVLDHHKVEVHLAMFKHRRVPLQLTVKTLSSDQMIAARIKQNHTATAVAQY